MEQNNINRVFDKKWFLENQKLLLWFLNSKKFGENFRSSLGIKTHRRIVKILPNCYHYHLEEKYFKAVFFSGSTVAKKLSRNYNMLWTIFHWWDMNFANKIVPALNLGFDTFYPDADPESKSVDGYIYVEYSESGAEWSTIHDATTGTPVDSATQALARIKTFDDRFWQRFDRGIILFDTSSIGSGNTVTDADLSLYKVSCADGLSITPDLDVVSVTTSSISSLSASDYDNFGHTPYASWGYSQWSGGSGYLTLDLGSSGEAAVNVEGVSYFGLLVEHDTDDTEPSFSSSVESGFVWYTADDNSDPVRDPYLEVTYEASFFPSMIL